MNRERAIARARRLNLLPGVIEERVKMFHVFSKNGTYFTVLNTTQAWELGFNPEHLVHWGK